MAGREICISEIDPFIIQCVVMELLCARHCIVLRIQRQPPQSVGKTDTDNPGTLRNKFRRTYGRMLKGYLI